MPSQKTASTDMTLSLHLEDQLCFLLYSASLAMTQVYKPLLEPIGLTYPQYLVMLILWERDGVSLKEIGQRLGQKSGALTPVLKRMEEDGLIAREKDKKDERALNIHLTEQGRTLRDAVAGVVPRVVEATSMSIEELVALRDTLARLRSNLLEPHI